MRFEFATATRIIFGAGTLRQLGPLAAELGRRALLVTGSHPGRAAGLIGQLSAAGITVSPFVVPGEPTTDLARQGVQAGRDADADLIIACGGGSALDAGKAIAALLSNGGDPLDYLEVIGAGRPLTQPALPFIAIPTTAGTGSEVTRNAVLGSAAHRIKVSLRSPLMLPRLALVDPELTYDLPRAVTISTGLDALTQLIEPFVSHRANPMTDALCREGIGRVARALPRAAADGQDAAARADMALGALWGGLALANAALGAVHGLAGPLGGMLPDAAHGAICAALLPHVMAVNVAALRQRQVDGAGLARFDETARLLTGDAGARAADGAAWLHDLCAALAAPGLATFGLSRDHFPELIAKAQVASSMKGNPVALTEGELLEIVERAL
jgi:alcohol dehydrogenase class IV